MGNASLGDEQTVMFDEKSIQETLNKVYDQVRSQEDTVVVKAKQKFENG